MDLGAFDHVDVHCHVDLFRDPAAALRDATGVYVIAMTNAPSVFEGTEQIAASRSGISPALGLHPELVEERAGELELMFELMPRTRFIGEIGLDYTDPRPALRRKQRLVLEAIVEECAGYRDKVLSVHSRRAETDTVAILSRGFPGKVIMHWYSGGRRALEQAIDAGFYFSANPAMARSRSGTEILRRIPQSRILTETDAPFVCRAGRSGPLGPGEVGQVIERLAELWEAEVEQVRMTVLENLRSLLHSSERRKP